MKKVLGLFLIILMFMTQLSAAAKIFHDVPPTYEYYEAIDFTTDTNILNEFSDIGYRVFRPELRLSRDELAALIVRNFIYKCNTDNMENPFIDISDHWAGTYILNLYLNGIVKPEPSKLFRPSDNVTYSEALQWLINAFGFEKEAMQSGGFPNGYLTVANKKGLTSGMHKKDGNSFVNRGEIAQLFYNAINLNFVTENKLNLYCNANPVILSNPLYKVGNNIISPIRTVSEELNISVDWNDVMQTITLSKENTRMILTLESYTYTINGRKKTLSQPPQVIDSTTYVPLMEIAEEFGYFFSVDLKNGNVFIYEEDTTVPILAPDILQFDKEYIKNPDTNKNLYAKLKYNGHKLLSITLDAYTLKPGIDYNLVGSYVVFKKEFIRSLPPGNTCFSLNLENDTVLYANLSIIKQRYEPVESNYKLFSDEREIFTDTGLYTINNQFLAPLRSFSEGINVFVSWEQETSTVTLEAPFKTVSITLNNYFYTVNGLQKPLDIPLTIINDRTMIPIKAVAKEFGSSYRQDILYETIHLTTPEFVIIEAEENAFDCFLRGSQVNFKADSKSAGNTSFLLACYNATGTLLSVHKTTHPLDKGINDLTLSLPPLEHTGAVSKIKILVWTDTLEMRPLNHTLTIDQNEIVYD